MPFDRDMKPKKPRTVIKTVARKIEYSGQGDFKDIVTKDEVKTFYPELKRLMNNSPVDFLYSKLVVQIEDPEKRPSEKFENEVALGNIEIYGDAKPKLFRKKYDENGNIVLVKNPKTNEPITFSVFDPDGDTLNTILNKLEKKIISDSKDGKWTEIELPAYKQEGFKPDFPVYKASAKDLESLKITGSVQKRKFKLKESWIKANPIEAEKLKTERPEYFNSEKTTGYKDHKSDFKQKEI